ncbi:16S rRNA (guanine(527)-N(7))-methyltransferase RsmG [uncultured Tateyamaria sp.]|uniref:16S rRNA (guanine(527)-N(7))-methyltransferase RsmG n=1 Tax=uncultured Tateyamaria sp. TaxID=455651 RepID=UPI00261487A2|nr:16S rRNA (guanine(527)-N(7))-methyltransferase RsmG [uncultured Tateyamaria sp.]
MRKPDWFAHDVSRETLDRLEAYAALLLKWTGNINLIAKSTRSEVEDRHIWDSAQTHYPAEGKWLDIGSGGGLPGVVVAILAKEQNDDIAMTMVESDHRKATFLRTCARELDLGFTVIADRVERVAEQSADTVSARALADLDSLLSLSTPHLASDGVCVFMKGARWREEIEAASTNWRFSYDAKPSNTNPEAAILTIRDIERV